MSSSTPLNPLDFRRALGNFATGITVMTASHDGKKVGVTANSFNSVSLDPPLILWSIDKNSSSFDVFQQASHFVVNVLAADQIEISNRFSRPSDDKFSQLAFTLGAGDAPVLPHCAATFECETHNIIEGGDHWIILGKVVQFTDCGRAPLLYHQGSYSMVLPFSRKTEAQEGEVGSEQYPERKAHDNLYYLMLQAIRHYQSEYQPKQLATGLRTAEARILMSLGDTETLSQEALALEVNMPNQDMQSAFQVLQTRGLIEQSNHQYQLQPAGIDLAHTLWRIADEEQNQRFSSFSSEDVATFRRMLKALTQTS